MSIADFLFSLHKLLAWLFALLTVLLPQHLLGPLPATDAPTPVPVAATQRCGQTSVPPRKLVRAALRPSKAQAAAEPIEKSTAQVQQETQNQPPVQQEREQRRTMGI